jgi:Cu(I)/Ag(I) efflux system membrane fusion protein/cobalt-zinc-cadmium efflux system membrane fusion protein
MNRTTIGAVILTLVVIGTAAIAIRTNVVHGLRPWLRGEHPQSTSAKQTDIATPPMNETPRGDVTLDIRRQQLIGVRTARVTRSTAAPTIRAVGIVKYDETRLKDINIRIDGWVRHLNVDYTGQRVRKGDPLFILYSPEILATQREYLLAKTTRDALAQSHAEDIQHHAEQLVEAARQRLVAWDIAPVDVAKLEESGTPDGLTVFRSPFDGLVLEKPVIDGMHVTAGQTLYKVGDLSVVWVDADIYERDAKSLHLGTPVSITVDAYPGEHFGGKTTFIYPTVNEDTRTLKARLALSNPGERLKPGMFAQVELNAPAAAALVAPTDAVLDSGTEQVVFMAQGEGRFHPQRVKIGRRLPDGIEILEGVREGDEVATSAAFFLDSESQLRASLQDYAASTTTGPATALSGGQLDIVFRTTPDPPKTGENSFEVTVKDAKGKPIADADVSVQFYMPPMPTMNMPAMRNTVKVAPAGGGVYRGSGEVMMGGRWDVTVSVTSQGQSLGSKQIAVVAR